MWMMKSIQYPWDNVAINLIIMMNVNAVRTLYNHYLNQTPARIEDDALQSLDWGVQNLERNRGRIENLNYKA